MGRGGVPLALCLALLALQPGCGSGPPPPNLVLISIDTLRADRLGAYGYDRPTSPHIDRLAADGVRFRQVIAESSWTLPSHMTLLTGLHPTNHGVTTMRHRLPPGIVTLAQVLKARGYATWAFVDGGLLMGRYGYSRGFDVYQDIDLPGFATKLRRTTERLAHHDRRTPFFVFLHTYDVHCPYEPPARWAAAFRTRGDDDVIETKGRCGQTYYDKLSLRPGQVRYLSDRYDAQIRAADETLGPFFHALEEGGWLERSVVALVSDHGEAFYEHGHIGHHGTLYVETLRVPFIVRAPGLAPRVVDEGAGLVDVVPTLLGLLGISPPPGDGRDLLAADPGAARGGPLFSELDEGRHLRSVLAGNDHLILDLDGGTTQWFDLAADPAAARPLPVDGSPRATELQAMLESHVRGLAPREPPVVEGMAPENVERLRALGYVR